MIKTGHLGRIKLFSLVSITAVTNVFLSYPQQFAMLGGSAGWILPLVSTLLALLVWWIIAPILKKNQELDIQTLTTKYIGKWGVWVLYTIIILFFMSDCFSTLRLFSETVVTTVLPRSPISFIAIPFALVIAYFAYTGIEGLTRVAWLVLPWLTLGLCALLILNLNWMDPEYIQPYMGKGIMAILSGGGVMTGVFLNIIGVLLLSGLLRHPADATKIGFWSILAVGLTYSVVTLVFIMVFPPESSMRTPFPMYQLGRLIYVGRFFTRMEAAFVFIWVAMAVIKLSFLIWACSYLYANMMNMPVNRPVVAAMTLIMYSLSFITRNFPEMLELNTSYLLHFAWIVVVAVPLVMMLWVRFRMRRKGGEQDEQTSRAS